MKMKHVILFENFVEQNNKENEDTINEEMGGDKKNKMKCKDVGVQKKTAASKQKLSSGTKGDFMFYKISPKNPKFATGDTQQQAKYFVKRGDSYEQVDQNYIGKMKKRGKVSVKDMPQEEIKKALKK